jgi:hypothetical protein
MRCPECGEEVYGQFAHYVQSEPKWTWKCKKQEPKLIDPAVMLDLVEKAISYNNLRTDITVNQ